MVRLAARAALLLACATFTAASCADRAAARGRQLYAEHGCAVCHGAEGHGDGPSVKRLDAVPRDFADPRGYRNGATQDQVARSIRTGVGSMPPFRDLTEDEARDIAAWVVSRQASAGAGSR
jgi:cytochrome c553